MSCPPLDTLEAHARGDLEATEKSRVRAHLAACDRCSREARILAAELQLFERRAAHQAPALVAALPSFDAVLARAGAERRPDVRRAPRFVWTSVGLAAAAALGLFWAARALRPVPAADTIADAGIDLVCADGEPAVEVESRLRDVPVASVDDEHATLLLSTPMFNDGSERSTMSCSVDVGP